MKKVSITMPYPGELGGKADRVITNPGWKESGKTYYAKDCLRESLFNHDEAPHCTQLLYFQEGILDIENPEDFAQGRKAGAKWDETSDTLVVYIDLGISPRMMEDIKTFEAADKKVVFRSLFEKDISRKTWSKISQQLAELDGIEAPDYDNGNMKRVVVESAYDAKDGDVMPNIKYARRAMKHCLDQGHAPTGSHLVYTQVTHDDVLQERRLGIDAGLIRAEDTDKTEAFLDKGMTAGVEAGIRRAQKENRPVELITLDRDVSADDYREAGIRVPAAVALAEKSSNERGGERKL